MVLKGGPDAPTGYAKHPVHQANIELLKPLIEQVRDAITDCTASFMFYTQVLVFCYTVKT